MMIIVCLQRCENAIFMNEKFRFLRKFKLIVFFSFSFFHNEISNKTIVINT